MSYNSPIELFQTEPIFETLKDEVDAYVIQAVAKVGVSVDKEELLKALRYDRAQYLMGFNDGMAFERNKPAEANADKLRAMSDEELAEFLREQTDCVRCVAWSKEKYGDVWNQRPCYTGEIPCKEMWLRWIKEEVNANP